MAANDHLVPALLALGLVFCLAVGLGWLIHRLEIQRGLVAKRDHALVSDGISGALGFIGGTASFLLGVLMLTSIDHFKATQEVARAEATAFSAAFDATAALADEPQSLIRRDLVCLMRSVVEDSWHATAWGDLTGDENTHSWVLRAHATLYGVDAERSTEEAALQRVGDQLAEAVMAGQSRLLSAAAFMPITLWILVYVGLFVVFLVVTLLLRPYPLLASVALVSMLLLTAAMIWTLAAYEEPFNQDDGVYIAPNALDAVMTRLRDAYPGPAWEPCERLARSEMG